MTDKATTVAPEVTVPTEAQFLFDSLENEILTVNETVEAFRASLLTVGTKAGTITAGITYFTGMYGAEVAALLPEIDAYVSVIANAKSADAPVKRIRGYEWFVNGKPIKDVNGKSTVSAAAVIAAVKPEAIVSAFLTEAGTNDRDAWPESLTFVVSGENGDAEIKAFRSA